MSKDLRQKYEDFREFSVAQWIMMKVPQKKSAHQGNKEETELSRTWRAFLKFLKPSQ